MNCAWQAYKNLLPHWLKPFAEEYKDVLQEIRLRKGYKPLLISRKNRETINRIVTEDDLLYVLNIGAKYSPWSTESLKHGYITASGGHRIGICGSAIMKNGEMSGIRIPTSVCIRVSRSFLGSSNGIPAYNDSILIIGCPGSGKTTLLRDLIQRISADNGICVAVVDEREEMFPLVSGMFVFEPGEQTDVISGCSKKQGVQMALRTMNPDYIAVDEITSAEDCTALLHAGWCGVPILATAHAASVADLLKRPVYESIVKSCLFQHLIVLDKNKTWKYERMPG